MPHLNIDGQKLDFNFNGDGKLHNEVIKFLESSAPFILHDGDRIGGMIVFPDKLICIHFGEVLLHKGIAEFQFTLSFYVGVYSCVNSLEQKEISYSDRKLLDHAAANLDQTP